MIGVTGCRSRMPPDYPLVRAENAGNMIHARAPKRILKNTVDFHMDPWSASGEKSFADFVNNNCSHFVISMTNTIKLNTKANIERYTRFQSMLELYDVPIVIFGLGVKSPTHNLDEIWLPAEGVELLQYMERRCGPIGVRGEFTKQVFKELAGVTDVVVTGCPSFFSEPKAFAKLRENLKTRKRGIHTYATTRFERPQEVAQFARTVRNGGFYIETTNAVNHAAHLQAMRWEEVAVPNFLSTVVDDKPEKRRRGRRGFIDQGKFTRQQLEDFYRSRYRLFRNPDDWLQFNREIVSFGYGTRFHVNMATMLSGTPATWITHDTRTREFCEFLRLPHVELDDSTEMEPEDFLAAASYDEMFDHLPSLFQNWADYLAAHNLEYSIPRGLI